MCCSIGSAQPTNSTCLRCDSFFLFFLLLKDCDSCFFYFEIATRVFSSESFVLARVFLLLNNKMQYLGGLACDRFTYSIEKAWQPPAEHEVKVNVHGGISRDRTRGAAAAVCRDKRGNFLGASVMVLDGLVDPAILEARASSEAVALATDLHAQSMCIASDCAQVVRVSTLKLLADILLSFGKLASVVVPSKPSMLYTRSGNLMGKPMPLQRQLLPRKLQMMHGHHGALFHKSFSTTQKN